MPITNPTHRRRGYTLVELMVALSIFAFASSAIASLMFATYNTNRHVKGMADSSSAAELTLRRMIELGRSAVDILYVDNTTGFQITTPPDSNSYSYRFVYFVDNNQLKERIISVSSLTGADQEIQTVTLIPNLQSMTVTRLNPGAFPECYQVKIVLRATPVNISRDAIITARNLTS